MVMNVMFNKLDMPLLRFELKTIDYALIDNAFTEVRT